MYTYVHCECFCNGKYPILSRLSSIMAEGTLKSYDPRSYYVNNISDLDPEVVKAHRNKDREKQSQLLSRGKNDFDVFICVNRHAHAFVLCVPCGPVDQLFDNVLSKDPFQIPEIQLCWRYELCFESQELRMYKIKKEFSLFKDIKGKVDKSFYVGMYKDVCPIALQFAALRSAPHRYSALLSDCVEFSKEFCVSMLSYCSNWKQLEEQVNNRIREASATGLSVERLSRKVRSSAWFGNLSLGGADLTSLLSGRSAVVIVIIVVFLLVYPIFVAVVVALVMKYL